MNNKRKIEIVIFILLLLILVIILSNRLFKGPPAFKHKQMEMKLPEKPKEIKIKRLELPHKKGIVEEETERFKFKPKEEAPETNLEDIPFETLPPIGPEEIEKETEEFKEPVEERLQVSPSSEELRKIKEKSLIIY